MPLQNTAANRWLEVLSDSFFVIVQSLTQALPAFIGALALFLSGWILALAVEKAVVSGLRALKFEKIFSNLGIDRFFQKAETNFNTIQFTAGLVRWFIVLVFIFAAADVLRLDAITDFLRQVILYIPNIIVAAIILLVTASLADFFDRLVVGSIRSAGFAYAKFVGGIIRWSVLIFGFVAALQQLGIAKTLLNTLVTGMIAMIALAGGLAFGLGGKDADKELIDGLKERIKDK